MGQKGFGVSITGNASGLTTAAQQADAALGKIDKAALKAHKSTEAAFKMSSINFGPLDAAASQFRSLAGAAEQVTGAMGKGWSAMSVGLGAAGVAGAVALAGKELIDFVGGQAQAVVSLDRTAKASGVSVASLVTLHNAADEAGVGAEAMDGALSKLTKTLGAAKVGSAPAVDAFMALGITARQIAAMTPEVAINRIADALSMIPDPAVQAKLTTDLMGKSAGALVPVLAQGSGALDDIRQKLESIGAIPSPKAIDQMREMNAAAHDLGDSLDALKLAGAVAFVPLAKAAAEAANAIVSLKDTLPPSAVTALRWGPLGLAYKAMMPDVGEPVKPSQDALDIIKDGQMKQAAAAQLRSEAMDQRDKLMKAVETPMDKYRAATQQINDLKGAGVLSQQDYNKLMQHEADIYTSTLPKLKDMTSAYDKLAEAKAAPVKDLKPAASQVSPAAATGDLPASASGAYAAAMPSRPSVPGFNSGRFYNPNVTPVTVTPIDHYTGAASAAMANWAPPAMDRAWSGARLGTSPETGIDAGRPSNDVRASIGVEKLNQSDPETKTLLRAQVETLRNIERELTYNRGLG